MIFSGRNTLDVVRNSFFNIPITDLEHFHSWQIAVKHLSARWCQEEIFACRRSNRKCSSRLRRVPTRDGRGNRWLIQEAVDGVPHTISWKNRERMSLVFWLADVLLQSLNQSLQHFGCRIAPIFEVDVLCDRPSISLATPRKRTTSFVSCSSRPTAYCIFELVSNGVDIRNRSESIQNERVCVWCVGWCSKRRRRRRRGTSKIQSHLLKGVSQTLFPNSLVAASPHSGQTRCEFSDRTFDNRFGSPSNTAWRVTSVTICICKCVVIASSGLRAVMRSTVIPTLILHCKPT